MSEDSSTIKGGRTKFKIIFLGDQSVGKSSIIEKYIKDKFEEGLNVSLPLLSPPSASIFTSKTSPETANISEYNSGTQQDSNDSEVSSPTT
jgi:GTPase SAR1 family protein